MVVVFLGGGGAGGVAVLLTGDGTSCVAAGFGVTGCTASGLGVTSFGVTGFGVASFGVAGVGVNAFLGIMAGIVGVIVLGGGGTGAVEIDVLDELIESDNDNNSLCSSLKLLYRLLVIASFLALSIISTLALKIAYTGL